MIFLPLVDLMSCLSGPMTFCKYNVRKCPIQHLLYVAISTIGDPVIVLRNTAGFLWEVYLQLDDDN